MSFYKSTFAYLGFALLIFTSCISNSNSSDTSTSEVEINRIMDDWHHAAATGDEEVFFGAMKEDAIYLGTDKTERWEKEVFQNWSKKYFERDTAWAFTPYDRVIYFSPSGETAWFEELLETWMGPCRGSGVLTRDLNSWKLAHYNLAMLIDNDDVNQVIAITQAQDSLPLVLPDSQ